MNTKFNKVREAIQNAEGFDTALELASDLLLRNSGAEIYLVFNIEELEFQVVEFFPRNAEKYIIIEELTYIIDGAELDEDYTVLDFLEDTLGYTNFESLADSIVNQI